jgi:hypothetical protein
MTYNTLMENTAQLTVWLVVPGVEYEGENAFEARLFYAEADARAYEAELLADPDDYVVVRQLTVA